MTEVCTMTYEPLIGGWLPTASREPRYERTMHFIGSPDGALCGGNVDETRIGEHRRWRLCRTCTRMLRVKPRYADDTDETAHLRPDEVTCMGCGRVYRWESWSFERPVFRRRLFCSRTCRDQVMGA